LISNLAALRRAVAHRDGGLASSGAVSGPFHDSVNVFASIGWTCEIRCFF